MRLVEHLTVVVARCCVTRQPSWLVSGTTCHVVTNLRGSHVPQLACMPPIVNYSLALTLPCLLAAEGESVLADYIKTRNVNYCRFEPLAKSGP